MLASVCTRCMPGSVIVDVSVMCVEYYVWEYGEVRREFPSLHNSLRSSFHLLVRQESYEQVRLLKDYFFNTALSSE